ncbi:MAG: class B sortase [Oscillospiraceae bacterium]|nr:class B sortase [Oscillospiraceae bacterium]
MPELDIRRKYTYGKKKKKKKKENFAVSLASDLLPWPGDELSDAVRKIVFIVSLAALVISAVVITNFYLGDNDGPNPQEHAMIIHMSNEKVTLNIPGISGDGMDNSDNQVEVIEKYVEYYEKNNDFVGFLSIDPYINYPVVQSEGDNTYYLKRNFDKVPTENGTIFADWEGIFTPTERPHNIILYGHNLLTKNGFQPLANYRKSFEFLKANPTIKFDTLYETGTYKIVSVFLTNTKESHGEVFNYWSKNSIYFTSQGEFYDFVTEILDRSYYHTGVDIEYGDEFITLSTCDFSALSDLRLVIVARRVREFEDPRVDTDLFVDNRGVDENNLLKRKMFEAFYNIQNAGRGWGGRNWDTSLVKGLDEYLAGN